MKYPLILFWAAVWVLMAGAAYGQFGNDPFAGGVTWKSTIDKADGVQKGEVVTVTFEATIRKGLHVFSAKPPDKDANLPTELVADGKGCAPEGPLAESGKLIEMNDEVFETQVRYYKDSVTFRQKFKVKDPKAVIKGTLKYQVCDEAGLCTMQMESFSFTLK